MTIQPHTNKVDTSRAFKLRHEMALKRLDYDREVVHLVPLLGQSGLSRALHVSQPTIHDTVKKASKLAPVKPGFSGASPYEIAQRYAVGEIGRDALIDQLARWDYAPQSRTDGYDSLLVDPPGTFDEVGKALSDGLLDDATYDAIIDRREELNK
ncbi:hypothetical protein AB0P28_14870 [Pseudarthrobacter sp. NPDC089323]